MRFLFSLILALSFSSITCQDLILPVFITNHARTNYQRLQFFSTSMNNDGSALFFQTDLVTFRHPNIKLAGEYFRNDDYSNKRTQSIKLKGNYYLAVTRKLSAVFSGSGGLIQNSKTNFSYSGGTSIYTEAVIGSYHLFGQSKNIIHSFQLKIEPLFKLKKQISKYEHTPYLSIQGNYTMNDQNQLNPNSNYLQACFEFENLNFNVGIHESEKNIRPNIGFSFDKINHLELSTNLFFNKAKIPSVQFSFIYKKRNKKRHYFIHSIPGTPSF